MKKDLTVIGGLFTVIVLFVIFGNGLTSTSFVSKSFGKNEASSSAIVRTNLPVKINTLSVNAVVAANNDDRKQGLSRHESLSLDEGMLFVFDKSEIYPIWMKNMKLAIDIIWIDEYKKVVDIAVNAAPEPDKSDKQLTIYRPNAESKYVLEVNAGLSDLNNIQVGDIAEF